ncbi:MAG TPA: hypothetical protein VLX92_23655, partial [Kofleriaceae bacterium]|nr:hypothetical protein [Kofleriaceae bacterium]
LVAAASRLDRAAPPVAIELAIAIGELELHAAEPDPVAFATLAALGDELAGDPAHVDAVFAARQLCAAHALMRGELEPAARALRAIVALAKDAGSPADEIEARLALAAALVEARDPIGLQEAGRLVELARDRAREHGLVQLGDAARIAQAGVLAATGKTGAALDRVLELARAAAANHDVAQYVAAVGIMAELYARTGDHVSAFRTIAEAHRALADATGQDATPLFRPLLARLRDRVGAARLEQIAADVDRANRLAAELRRPEPSDRE